MENNIKALVESFSPNKIFSSLTREELATLLRLGSISKYNTGKVLFMSGEAGQNLYLIVKGIVRISDLNVNGREIIVNSLSSGDVFGEVAVLDGKSRTMGATCETDVEILLIPRKAFLSFIENRPKMLQDILGLLCSRIRWCTDMLESSIFQSVLGKIIYQLFILIDKGAYVEIEGDKAMLDISQEQLSKMVGSTREVVNRNLQYLSKDGVIVLKRGGVIIPKISALKKYMEDKGGVDREN